jgi:hypothetical protein
MDVEHPDFDVEECVEHQLRRFVVWFGHPAIVPRKERPGKMALAATLTRAQR